MDQMMSPLFQTNLLLHMCIPYPRHSGFNPYLYNQGYRLKHIDKTIPLTKENIDTLKSLNIDKTSVTPEAVIAKEDSILLFECKMGDFEIDFNTHSAKQAAGYFTLNSKYLKDYFGITSSDVSGKILYGVPNDQVHLITKTLNDIKQTLKCIQNSLPHDVFSININKEGTFISFKENDEVKIIKIIDSTVMFHNSLIYIMPVEPSGRIDAKTEKVMKSQAKMHIRRIIGRRLTTNGFEFSTLEICKNINPLWDTLQPKFRRKMYNWIDNAILKFISDLESKKIKVLCQNKLYRCLKLNKKQIQIVETNLRSDSLFDEVYLEDFDSIQLTLDI